MSSVLIRGMEMPENCYDCPLIRASVAGDYYCAAGDGIEENLNKLYERRMSGCPLVEVKEPHDDLVDRGWVRDSVNHSCWIEHNDYLEAIGIIDDAPTIIEAEGSEE